MAMLSNHRRPSARAVVVGLMLLLVPIGGAVPLAQNRGATHTSPKTQFGHDIGDDYSLVNYTP